MMIDKVDDSVDLQNFFVTHSQNRKTWNIFDKVGSSEYAWVRSYDLEDLKSKYERNGVDGIIGICRFVYRQ